MTNLTPTPAASPFSLPEVQGNITVPLSAPLWRRYMAFTGPGLLVAVGYVDPGNWATDIAAGARYGYALLFMIALSSLMAIFLQCIAMRIGIVTGRDLARLTRERLGRKGVIFNWLAAEVAIIACDVAEVLGCALAFKLLLGCPLWLGVILTALDTLLILGLRGRGFRQIEAIVLGLMLTIGVCYIAEIWLVQPHWPDVIKGFIPTTTILTDGTALYLAIGILGATVMPHNLYLHSSIVNTRRIDNSPPAVRDAIRLNTVDTTISLCLAFLVNAAILVLAATAFHGSGHTEVADIEEAYHLLDPLVGVGFAAVLFGIALLASGQSSTFTGTIAGQVILEGFLDLRIPFWQRRLITRGLALLPAFFGVVLLGDNSVGGLMVLSQVVLGLQLPFAMFMLIRIASTRGTMGEFAIPSVAVAVAWGLFTLIVTCNLWLMWQLATGG